MIRVLLLTALILGLTSPGIMAQEQADTDDNTFTHKEYVAHIRQRVLAAEKQHRSGDKDGAYRALDGVRDDIAPYHDFLDGHTAIWWPDLVSARLKRRDKNYATVEALALPIVQALDNETHRSGETRMEALLLLTTALYFQSKYEEAVVIVRGMLLDAPEDLKPRWRLHAELYQAIAATRSKAPEAAVMRAALLDGYMDRETAKVGDYLYLWRLDLQARRGAKADKTALVRDARAVLEFIRTDEAALKRNNEKLEAMLARIFAENKDFKRAEPILRARLAEMETGTTEYYWAWQNVLAMNYLQKKYTLVLRDTRPLLEELEGKDDTYARVTSFLYRFLALSARATGDDALFHDAIQRSYVEIRRIRSANHSDALKVRSRISIAAIDPETYPYAAELGVERREAGKLTIQPNGSSVLEEFFAGRGMSVGPKLERYARDNENSTIAQLNLGLHYALMGQIGPSEDAIAKARGLARQASGGPVPANSPWFDIILTVNYVWGRDWKPEKARDPLERLRARTDLSADQKRTVSILNLLLQRHMDNFAEAQRIVRQELADYDPSTETTTWGLFRALSVVFPMFEVSQADAEAIIPKVRAAVENAGSPRLAALLLPVFRATADPYYLTSEQNFQALAYQVQGMSRMLPPEHMSIVVGKISYANALRSRGQMDDALHLMTQAARTYRLSPWHRADVNGFLDIQQAILHFELGNTELAQAMIAESFAALDRATYRPLYWREILTTYVDSLQIAGRSEDALQVTTAVLEDPGHAAGLSPFDLMELMKTHAVLLANTGNTTEALNWLERARAVLPSEEYKGGFPMIRVLEQTALVHYNLDDFEAAYRAQATANDLYFRGFEAISSDTADRVARNREFELIRVINEASYAWNFAQRQNAAVSAE